MNWPVYGQDVLASLLPKKLRELDPPPSSIHAVVDARAEAVTRAALDAAAARLDAPVHRVVWEAAEQRKCLAEVESLARRVIGAGVDRRALILALGGGVTTDLGGFLAAVLLRGLRWGAVPTTLLGMADAALGGKTAVDLPEGKNLLGAFHAPEFVLCDVSTLSTLPPREWSCGLGEILKAALIGDARLLRVLEEESATELRRPGPLIQMVAEAAGALKMRVVEEDPEEGGLRKILNLGHTFGHALETAAGHAGLAHGEAVGLGLLCAASFAEDMEVASRGLTQRLRRLLDKLGLPARYPGRLPSRSELIQLLQRDKKAAAGRLDLVLPVEPGECLLLRGVEAGAAADVVLQALGE